MKQFNIQTFLATISVLSLIAAVISIAVASVGLHNSKKANRKASDSELDANIALEIAEDTSIDAQRALIKSKNVEKKVNF